MRHAFFALAAVVLAALAGCAHHHSCCHGSCQNAPETCRNCDPAGAGGGQNRAGGGQNIGSQPGPSGVVSYPYYTTRGPRDFLDRNPQSIGP